MLERLTIQNVALIERAEVEFSAGLNVLTGETGAGKSVILDCIDFVLGAKAERSMIRFGASECSVRAEFLGYGAEVRAILQEFDIEEDGQILIARKLTPEGKSIIRVNGEPVTLAMLRRITAQLVDVHGQSEHFFLLKESNQLKLLDSLAGEGAAAAKAQVQDCLDRKKGILASMKELGGDESERLRRLDILNYQIEELLRADLREGEEEELLQKRALYQNSEKLMQALNAAHGFLLSDGGSADGVSGAKRALSSLSRFGEAFSALAERLENVSAEIEDIGGEVEERLNDLDIDEAEAERVEQRLEELRTLKKKYGGSVEAAIGHLAHAQAERDLLTSSAENYEKLAAQLVRTEDELYTACLILTAARKQCAEKFTVRVTDELKTLNIPSARFEIQFGDYSREDVGRATGEGLGSVRFLFSANAGEPPKELGAIISGGEMSRFMLAIKAQLSSVGEIGAYIFDEIDAGIGGKTARVVAEKFFRISRGVQVIAVTHLAQIACFADRSFYLEKSEREGRTLSEIRPLEGDARLIEIARLIDGTADEISRKHAAELLQNAEIYKNSL